MEPSKNNNSREPYINLFFAILIPLGLFAVYSAIKGLRLETPQPGLVILFIVTVFFGSILRFQLPRTKIHLTISDALIFLSLLLYGGSVAIILGTLEAAFTAMMLRRQGVRMSWKTVSINVLIATISVLRHPLPLLRCLALGASNGGSINLAADNDPVGDGFLSVRG